MVDIEELINNGSIGAGAVLVAEWVTGTPINATATAVGAIASAVAGSFDSDENKKTKTTSNTKKQEYPDTTNNELIKFNARHNPQSNSNHGANLEGGGFNRVHLFHHDGDRENEPHAPFPQGEDRNFFAFSEPSNYAERVEYEPFESETCTNCDKELQNVTKSNTVPTEVQESILKWKDKSPSKPCQKHEVEMPQNACYSCGSDGGMCDHLAKYDGSHKSTHCVYPETRLEVATASKRLGKPIKEHRNVNRTHLTGIERNNLMGLANGTNVDDKEALKQELTDHIDPTLSYSENKTLLQDYLASVTPINTDVTEREVMDYEARINAIAPEEIEQANDPFLLESLRERAANGDSSAGMQLELMEIKQEGFASMGLTPAQNVDTPYITMDNQMPLPIMDTAQNDPTMSWCSSTPETLKFSESFEPPPPEVVNDSCLSQPQATASPEMRNVL